MASMRTIGVKLRMETGQFVKDTGEAAKATDRLGDSIGKTGQQAKAGWDDIALGVGIAGGALTAFAGGAVMAAANFDKQMSEVGAVANATAGEMDQLRDAALQAGKDTVFSATEAAKAEAELAKAGLSTSQILGGALDGALSLAAAGSLDLAESADIAAKAMNMFGLEGEDVTHIADVLASAANKSATDVHEVGEALKMSGQAARGAGLSLEDTVGTLALFADNALSGSDAGTSLKTALMMLSAPTDKAAELMEELGIAAYDAEGNFVGVEKLAGQLKSQLSGLTQEQRNSALATIFGADAMRAASVLYTAGAEGVREYVTAVNDQGAAADMAAKKTDNLLGDVEKLTGSLETLAIESGSGANGGLRALTQGATALVDAFGQLPPAVTSTGVVLAGLGGVALLGMAGFIKAKTTVDEFSESLSNMGPKGEKAAGALGKVAGFVGKAGAWGAGALVAYEGLSLLYDYVQKATGPTARNVDKLTLSLKEMAASGKASGEVAKVFGQDLGQLAKDMELLESAQARINKLRTGPIGGGRGAPDPRWTEAHALEEALEQAKVDVAALDESLANLANNGGATQAKLAFQQLADATGLTADQLPKYTEAAGNAAVANSALAKGFGDAESSARTMTSGLQAAIDAGQSLKDVFDELNGATLGWRAAERQAEEAVDSLQAALELSNGSLDHHTDKGRAASAAVDSMAKSAIDAAQAKYEESGSLEEANRVYDRYIGQLRKTLSQAGLSKKEIDRLIDSIARVPKYKTTNVEVKIKYTETGFGNSAYAVYFSGGKVQVKRWGGITEHARDGLLRDAEVFSPQSPARYAFAEPETQGEAFIPKSGNYGRSMSTLQHAAGWYGADVVPRGGWYGGGGQVVRVEISGGVVVEGNGVISGFRREIAASGKTVQDYLGPAPRRP